jgi:PAS domain S-box-containing protein
MKKLKANPSEISRVAGLFTVLAGGLVLMGWIFHLEFLKSIFPAFGSMRYVTAVCFLFAGTVLVILKDAPKLNRFRKRAALILVFLLLLISLTSLASYFFNWNIDIERLLGNISAKNLPSNSPGRVSLIISFNFTMLGLAFLLMIKDRYYLLIQILLIAILPGLLLTIANRLIGMSFLNSIQLNVPTSLLTAILFIILFFGAFSKRIPGDVQFSFVKRIAAFFILILLIRSLVFFAINKNNELSAEKDKWVEQNRDLLLTAEKINSFSNDLQSRVRGYIITGREDPDFFSYRNTDSINHLFSKLRIITVENGHQEPGIDSLEKSVASFINRENEVVEERRKKGFGAARQLVLDKVTNALLEKVHRLVASIENDDNKILASRTAQNALIIRNSSKLFSVLQIIAILLTVLAFKIIYDHVRMRNKIEGALKKSLKETSDYKYALDQSSILAITDDNGIIRQVNDNFCRISKYHREELIGQDHRIMNSGYHSKEFMRDLWLTISNGEEWRGEIKNKAKDGSFFWLDTTIVPFMDDTGRPFQYLAIRSDITQRKNLEEGMKKFNAELQKRVEQKTKEVIEKEEKYRFLLQNMKEGIQVIGFGWEYIFVNESARNFSKYSEKELLGHTLMEKYPGIEKTELFKVLERCMKQRIPQLLENEFTFPDGTKQWFKFSIQPVKEGLFILSSDITEQVEAEQKLKESERFLSESQRVSKIGSYILDCKTRIWRGSTELDNIFGLNSNEVHDFDMWVEILHPDHRAAMQKYFEEEIMGKKRRFSKEYKIINRKTKQECWVHGLGDLILDPNGNVVKMLGTIQDITERKKMESELEDQKLNEQKVINEITIQAQEEERAELGRELHDNVNQILATAKMYLGMAKDGVQTSGDNLLAKSYEYIDEVMKEIRKLSHSLVAPSLGDIGLVESLQLLVEDTNILNCFKVDLCIDEGYSITVIDKKKELMIYRIIQEQLNNINKYAKADKVGIALRQRNGELFLTVTDNGIGFDPSQISKTGIGLRNMKSRLEFYSGKLNVITAPGKGCTLEINLPVSSDV